jgi:fungalysin metallopeptidase (M36)/fungalysin/thermolysin propeptide/VCBS repeat protein
MPRETRKLRALFVSAVVSVLFGLMVVSGQNPPADTDRQNLPLRESELMAQGGPLPDYDIRSRSGAALDDAQLRSAVDLKRQLSADTAVQFDPRSGGVSHIFRPEGYLTDAQTGSPSAVLNRFLVEHADLLGLSPAGISGFTTIAEDRDGKTGVTHLYLEQRMGGVRVFGSVLKGHVDRTGRLISIEGNYYPASANLTSASALSAEAAVAAALESSLPDVLPKVLAQQPPAEAPPGSTILPVGPPYRFPSVLQTERGTDRLTLFEKGPFAKPIRVRQVVFPRSDGSVLAWQVEVHAPSHQAYYVLLVDATTGTLLYRTNTYRSAVGSNASVFPKSPEGSPPATFNFFGDPVASPLGWSSGPATLGNNVQGDSATSTGDFSFPFTNTWKNTGANAFDLAGLRLRFTPTDTLASGYTVTASAAGSTAAAATNLLPFFTNTDDGTINLICGGGWTANVLGATFTSFWVNTNGSVSLGAGITDDFPSKVSFSNDARRIAGLWRDLNPGGGGTLTGDCAPEGGGTRIRVVWNAVPNFAPPGAHTFAIVVHGIGTGLDNIIDIDYGTVSSPIGNLVGVGGNSGTVFNPTTTGIVNYRDLSGGAAPGIAGGLAQTFPDPDLNLSITNFAYHLNLMHDYFYRMGFTETAGNYQTSNLTRGGAALDPIQAESQYALGTYNNAFFQVAPDGTPGFVGFGLFSTSGCRRDSGLDATVIYHEFAHGVSTRMVGGPQNVSTLTSFQGGALGEGWSDAFPISIFNDPIVGAYVTCNPVGLRSASYRAHPATYADFGNKAGGLAAGIGVVFYPEVHRDGEIWAAAAWEIHAALGSAVTQQLLFEAFRYTPVEPSMVDAKNAVLLADRVLYSGAHLNTLYTIFARRGLGVSAGTSPGSYSTLPLQNGSTTTVFAAFDTPSNQYAADPQSVVFSDSFDGADTWVVTGVDGAGGGALWHVSSRRSSSGANAFYYGKEADGTYGTTFRNYGALTSPDIQLPAIGANQTIALEWDHFRQTSDVFLFDGGFVRVLDVNAGTTTQVSFVQNTRTSAGTTHGFAHQKVNLQPFAGRLIKIQFFMDTLDAIANAAEGWYVDNVKLSVFGVSGPSTAVTTPATGIFSRGATLNGTGNPNGAPTAAYFEYGLTTSYGRATPQVHLGSGTAPVAIGGGLIVGLSCNTTYHFRAVTINIGGTSVGADAAFATTAAPCFSTVADVDGDSRSDLVVFRTSIGTWLSLLSSSGYTASNAIEWGESTDTPLGGDFDGDGKTDRTVYRPSTGMWFILKSSTNFTTSFGVQWGNSTDIPLQGDIDGDGRADLIIWRPSTGTWFWLTSSNGYNYANAGSKQWGNQGLGDIPIVADMDGDRKADLVVWRASTGTWHWLTSSSGYDYAFNGQKQWGNLGAGDVPLLGDVDGDGVADLIVWRAPSGTWYWLTSSSGYNYSAQKAKQWGAAGDIPLITDLDADGIGDLTIWRPSNGTWFWLISTSGYSYASAGVQQWGNQGLGDVPVVR